MAEWSAQFEGEHIATELVGLAVDSRGDVALAGHVFEADKGFVDGRKDAVVLKLSSLDGEFLWTRTIGVPGAHDSSSAVATDSRGNFFVAGQTDGFLFAEVTGAGHDLWVAKLDGSQGKLLWGYQVGSLGQDVASTLTVDPSTGDVVVCGSTTGDLYEDPGFVFEAEYGGGGDVEGLGEKGTEPFCAKLAAADGRVLWGSRLRGGANDALLAAAVDPLSGDVFAAGYTSESSVTGTDLVAVRLRREDGSELWRRTGGGGWTDPAYSDGYVQDAACAVAVDGGGGLVIAGNTEGALFGSTAAGKDTDAFVAKLNGTNGDHVWGWQRGSDGNDYANAVAVDSSGDVYACGEAPAGFFDGIEDFASPSSNLPFEGGEGQGQGVPTSSVADMFLAKLDGETGSLVWGAQFGSGADDQAVGLVLGPSAPGDDVDYGSTQAEISEYGMSPDNPLYLTGWTRGALYSSVPARWQDGWAVKLSNPPPKTLGVYDASATWVDSPPTAGAVSGTTSASDAARGARTAGVVSTAIGVVTLVLAGIYILVRRASYGGGSLLSQRYEQPKELFRRRSRASMPDGGGMKGQGGSGKDGVELTLLADNGDGDNVSPRSSRHGLGNPGGAGGGGRRDASPPPKLPPATFYI